MKRHMPSSKAVTFTAVKRKDKHRFYIMARSFNIPSQISLVIFAHFVYTLSNGDLGVH